MKFITESGAQYDWDPPMLARLSEVPVIVHGDNLMPMGPFAAEMLIEPEVGSRALFRVLDTGAPLRTSRVVEVTL